MENNENYYGLCERSLVGRYLVDQGLADTRARAIADALKDLWGAICECDISNLNTLMKKERWLVEAANKFAEIENAAPNCGVKDRSFDEELAKFHAKEQDKIRLQSVKDYETVKREG